MNKEIIVRDIKQEEFHKLTYLIEELGYPTSSDRMIERMNRISKDSAYKTIIAEIDGEIAGLIGLHKLYVYENDEFYTNILVLVVGEQYRCYGIGTKLIDAGENWARMEGAHCLVLTSGTKRTEAHNFYKNRGFEVTGYRFKKEIR